MKTTTIHVSNLELPKEVEKIFKTAYPLVMPQTLLGGTAHKLTADLKTALMADNKALAAWQNLTPLARNEWICWVTFPKQVKTRANHVKRVISELKDGIRRPCCWIGCTHRQDKMISKSVKWLMKRQSKSK